MPTPFPYLIISDANFQLYEGVRPGNHRRLSHELMPVLRGSTGYNGWRRPGHGKLGGPRPLANLIPRSEWTQRIQAGQGTCSPTW